MTAIIQALVTLGVGALAFYVGYDSGKKAAAK